MIAILRGSISKISARQVEREGKEPIQIVDIETLGNANFSNKITTNAISIITNEYSEKVVDAIATTPFMFLVINTDSLKLINKEGTCVYKIDRK